MSRGEKAGDGAEKPSRHRRLVFKCCSGYRHQQRTLIMKAKAKAGTKAVRRAMILQRIMTLAEAGVIADLNGAIAVFKRRIDDKKLEQVEKLLDAGKIDEAIAIIPWDDLPKDLERVASNLEKAALKGSAESIAALPGPKSAFIVGTANPNLRRFISSQVGDLVVEVSQDSRKAIQSAVTQSFDQGLTPRQTASIMRESIGLTEKQNIQVMNRQLKDFDRRDRLTKRLNSLDARGLRASPSARKIRMDLRNLTNDRIQKRTEGFARNLQKQRSITIARTELTRSVNQGQVETWLAAADEGLIERDQVKKVWVVVPDDRLSDICADLDGKSVALDEKFFVAQTGAMVDGPPAHPNCRSAVVLRFDDEEE